MNLFENLISAKSTNIGSLFISHALAKPDKSDNAAPEVVAGI